MNQSRGTKALELWCRRQIEGYPGVQIHNMTTSWKNGMAFCALVHHFRPDLIDFDKLNKSDVYYNNELAFRTAEVHLGIPALLDAADMAMYEVPDRLSILTYLSQYYQRFAAQEPKSPTSDKAAPITTATTPPPKIAPVAGVPKREPCQKCGNPVFLAERLTIGKSLYHRTCLRCARCESQLTPGSFYETEVDGVFCCETCPDEEKTMSKLRDGGATDTVDNANTNGLLGVERQSFRDKLAMFQSDGRGLLQKSLSDEEKSKSLKRLNDFLSKQEQERIETSSTSLQTVASSEVSDEHLDESDSVESSSGSDADDDDGEVPPPLPSSQPPSDETTAISSPDIANTILQPPSLGTTDTAMPSESQTPIDETSQLDDSIDNNSAKTPTNDSIPNDTSATNEASHNQISATTVEKVQAPARIDLPATAIDETIHLNPNRMPSDALNNFNHINNVTKEQKTPPQQSFENSGSESSGTNVDVAIATPAVAYRPSSTNMVRSRLSQFEALAETEQKRASVNWSPRHLSRVSSNGLNGVAEHAPQKLFGPSKSDVLNNQISNVTIEENVSDAKTTTNASHNVPIAADRPANINNDRDDSIDSSPSSNDINNKDIVHDDDNSSYHKLTKHVKWENDGDKEVVSHINLASDDEHRPVPLKRVTAEVTANAMSATANALDQLPTPSKRKNKVLIDDNEGAPPKEDITSDSDPLEPAPLPRIEINASAGDTNGATTNDKKDEKYPDNLNPFGSDDEDDDNPVQLRSNDNTPLKKIDTSNPFDSSDDEIELLKDATPKKLATKHRQTAQFRVSTNPFGSEDEDDVGSNEASPKRTPIPTPRKVLIGSSQVTPEPSPRMSRTLNPRQMAAGPHHDLYGSNMSLQRNSHFHGSMNSLSSSSTPRRKKGKAPPVPPIAAAAAALTAPPNSEMSPLKSASSSPSHSTRSTPLFKKKRHAPPVPPPSHTKSNGNDSVATLYVTAVSELEESNAETFADSLPNAAVDTDSSSALGSSLNSAQITSEDVAAEAYNRDDLSISTSMLSGTDDSGTQTKHRRKLIPLEASLLEDADCFAPDGKLRNEEEPVSYRRTIIPQHIPDGLTLRENDIVSGDSEPASERQTAKLKENKESQNKNRQSQGLATPTHPAAIDVESIFGSNKSSYGKWKRRKGPAPALPVPPRKVLQMLPLQDIRHELDVIEVQQLGLEKQGVMLEKMIRDRCEGGENENTPVTEFKPNSKEVEDLILQLFELVNEKNELFRRQAELMYLRRQHRLEQEQADIEYEIRVLMAQPECNKTDSDKTREEALISRLVEVVQMRNDVIESLEMDRLREAEEDQSIKERLELHTAKRDEEYLQQTPTKLSKKEKKKQKEAKKLAKQKKIDADKDADESEMSLDKCKEKKKKKKFLII